MINCNSWFIHASNHKNDAKQVICIQIQTYCDRLLQRHCDLLPLKANILRAFQLTRDAFRCQGKLLLCGNGGSAADADHIVGELMKGFLLPRPAQANGLPKGLQKALPALSLAGHTALATACANDLSAELVFAQQVYGYGRPGDMLWALTTSGCSSNVLAAAQTARAVGMHVVGFTGRTGGDLASYCDVLLNVPANTPAEAQEYHLPLYHTLCAMLEETFFGNGHA